MTDQVPESGCGGQKQDIDCSSGRQPILGLSSTVALIGHRAKGKLNIRTHCSATCGERYKFLSSNKTGLRANAQEYLPHIRKYGGLPVVLVVQRTTSRGRPTLGQLTI